MSNDLKLAGGKDTRIEVALPLPMDVAGTVMRLIGKAYPQALIEGGGRSMTFIIPESARPKVVSKNRSKPDERTDPELDLLSMGADGVSISTPEELADACLSIMMAAFEAFPEAENYLEQRCWDRETGKAFAMTFQKVNGKTPHEKRQEAEEKLAAAEEYIRALEGGQ